MNNDFDPFNMLMELQRIQQEQAENIVSVSVWMIEVSKTIESQRIQIDAMFRMLEGFQSLSKITDTRLKSLESEKIKEHK